MESSGASSGGQNEPEICRVKGHVFLRRTYHKPTYCHYCGDLLWGLMNQGFTCIICNMVSHEKWLRNQYLSPCTTLLPSVIKNPMPHAFVEANKKGGRRLFCCGCRRRIDDRVYLQCQLCETYAHCDCHRSILNNCRVFYSSATADFENLEQVIPVPATHVWREGNLPAPSKCAACNKTCSSTDCFSGLRCELCQLTVHSYCKSLVVQDCDHGLVSSVMLNASSVFIPPPVAADFKSQLAPKPASITFTTPADDVDVCPNDVSSRQDDESPLSSPNRADIKHRFPDELEIFVYDGRDGLRRGYRKQLFITSATTVFSALDGALRAFTLSDDPAKYELQVWNFVHGDLVPGEVIDPTQQLYCQLPITHAAPRANVFQGQGQLGAGAEGSSSVQGPPSVALPDAIHLLLKRRSSDAGFVTFYADWIKNDSNTRSVFVTSKLTVADAIQVVLKKFDLLNANPSDYVLRIVPLNAGRDRDEIIASKEILWTYLEQIHDASLSSASLSRVYIGPVGDLLGESPVSVYVGNLPTGRSQREYESAIARKLGQENRWVSIEAIYYEHGGIVLSFPNANKAVEAVKLLRDLPVPSFQLGTTSQASSSGEPPPTSGSDTSSSPPLPLPTNTSITTTTTTTTTTTATTTTAAAASAVGTTALSASGTSASTNNAASAGSDITAADKSTDKRVICMCLPKIKSTVVGTNVPVLVLVNTRSGGCQGVELVRNFRLLLNPYQVFSLENGGPLPALHAFREMPKYRVLCCGGDGTVGWVLSCLDIVSQDSACQSPSVAIMPLGTGNDLARVLNWGPGFTGTESLVDLLLDVMWAEDVNFDRWTISITPTESTTPTTFRIPANVLSLTKTTEDNSSILLMNNYFGIGVDAKLSLDFHNAREKQPGKFKDRIHNKGVYLKMALKMIVGKWENSDINRFVRIEVDGRPIELPPIDGIIILNIMSWGSGSDLWGNERSSTFSKPAHDDGLLEVVGINSVVHLGKISSGISSGIRLAQGEHIYIHLLQDMPLHVDGEPWIQQACHINVRRTALRAVMLKRVKKKMHRRNTEPPQLSSGGPIRGNRTSTAGQSFGAITREDSSEESKEIEAK